MGKIIQITVILFPDGQTYWFESIKGKEHLDKAIKLWQSKADKKYKNDGLNLCWAELKMFEDDYFNNLPATNMFLVE